MSSRIYLIAGKGLVAMSETPYKAEVVLQELLAEHADLLAGDQMRPGNPRRWLLVAREVGIPDAIGASDRWALDHLFVDQDAVPTLVEVKRSSDTRLRREVIGQMLDYAANVVAHWPPGEIRAIFEDRCRDEALDATDQVTRLLDGEAGTGQADPAAVERFWVRASENLAGRRIRLVFVADVIPAELQRIIEFLNESMLQIEVIALEVKQFSSPDKLTRAVVPRVIGQTAAALDLKRASQSSRTMHDWHESTFLDEVAASGGSVATQVARELLEWMSRNGTVPSFGKGKTGPMYVSINIPGGGSIQPFDFLTYGRIEVLFNALSTAPPFVETTSRRALQARLNSIRGVHIKDETTEAANWTSFSTNLLADPVSRQEFFGVLDWVARAIADRVMDHPVG